jgi:hypothetical protein
MLVHPIALIGMRTSGVNEPTKKSRLPITPSSSTPRANMPSHHSTTTTIAPGKKEEHCRMQRVGFEPTISSSPTNPRKQLKCIRPSSGVQCACVCKAVRERRLDHWTIAAFLFLMGVWGCDVVLWVRGGGKVGRWEGRWERRGRGRTNGTFHGWMDSPSISRT